MDRDEEEGICLVLETQSRIRVVVDDVFGGKCFIIIVILFEICIPNARVFRGTRLSHLFHEANNSFDFCGQG